MCGRYALFSDPEDLAAEFGLDDASYEATYNAAPSEELSVLLDDDPAAFSTARWGLVPSWSEGPKAGPDPINARAETLTERRLFAEAYRERRCLVPADGFYEWAETGDSKQPYFVTRADGRPLLLAGLWETWTPEQKQTGLGEFGSGGPSRDAEPMRSFTVVTTEPNDFLADYHHRMAVVLDPEAGERWLSADDPSDLLEPSDVELQAWPVSQAVNNPANDRPELVESVA
ncbi:SOS response-associated peptidase [Halobacterium sp. KA-4]|jgi:putative SOS response-associated peptidase YedK|uniref:SOS response-associated peptidase n=1 Tax=Halobacterium sp. KA-4 TaxID=2896367 RepID=UPI001E52F932|nr:SOS response-associated peptidase [Halobacterium sp. KA-4]MCD2199195.1 SOS response-associated peptidase [Halobacterium sp. KA-4]